MKSELEIYREIAKSFGFKATQCNNEGDELDMYKNTMDELYNTLNKEYLCNNRILEAERTCGLYRYDSKLMSSIFNNAVTHGFSLEYFKDCKFRILNSDTLNTIAYAGEFCTDINSKLLQVVKDDKVINYIIIKQQYPLETEFHMWIVEKSECGSMLCEYYDKVYNNKDLINIGRSIDCREEQGDPMLFF